MFVTCFSVNTQYSVRTEVVEVDGDVGGGTRADESGLDERRESILHVETGAALVVLKTHVVKSPTYDFTIRLS